MCLDELMSSLSLRWDLAVAIPTISLVMTRVAGQYSISSSDASLLSASAGFNESP